MPREADSFAPATRTPTAVDRLQITLTVYKVDGGPNQYGASYQFSVLDQDGAPMDERSGDLLPHLTAGRLTTIKGFLDSQFVKARASVGP